jgi:aryl-alcohol dehydrogenase-like predicted oxidoreductase
MMLRALGQGGLQVSAIGLGCLSMAGWYGAVEVGGIEECHAELYGAGSNEILLGRVLRPLRQEIVIATKFGSVWDRAGVPVGVDGRPEHVRRACDASLRRLGTDCIDLYYLHRLDPKVPIEDTVGAMAALVSAGKVRHLGVSEVAPETLRRAHATHPIAALQSEYSLWSRDCEPAVLPACRELGIGFVAYSPLGRGFLTGSAVDASQLPIDDARRELPRFRAENFANNRPIAAEIAGIAREIGCSAAQVALAWLLAAGADIVPLPGTRRRNYLEENIGALAIDLTPEQLAALKKITDRHQVAGDRYSPRGLGLIDQGRS